MSIEPIKILNRSLKKYTTTQMKFNIEIKEINKEELGNTDQHNQTN